MDGYKYKVVILSSHIDEIERVVAENLDEDIAIILMRALFEEYCLEEDLQIAIKRMAIEELEQEDE